MTSKTSVPVAFIVFVGLVLTLVALGVSVQDARLASIDSHVATVVRSLSGATSYRLARALGRLGSAQVWDASVLLIAGLLYLKRQNSDGLLLVLGVVTAEVGTIAVKALMNGPEGVLVQLVHFRELDGFPSGHVVRVVVALGILTSIMGVRTSRLPLVTGVSIVGGLLMGWARIESRSHSPSDIVGAYLISAIVLNVLVVRRHQSIKPAQAVMSDNDVAAPDSYRDVDSRWFNRH